MMSHHNLVRKCLVMMLVSFQLDYWLAIAPTAQTIAAVMRHPLNSNRNAAGTAIERNNLDGSALDSVRSIVRQPGGVGSSRFVH
jgi:hypothetical protein